MATGLLEGSLVSQLLTSLIDIVKKVNSSKKGFLGLQERLQHLQPLVDSLNLDKSQRTDSAQAADNKWLSHLRGALEHAHDLVSKCATSKIKRLLHADDIKDINERLAELLRDAVAIQLRELLELRWQLKELTSSSSHAKEGGIKRVVEQLQMTRIDFGDRASSSTPSISKSHWDRACDVPDPPLVTFGGEAVADKVIELILHGEYKKWIAMWGMGGVGKTCTALRLYHNPSIQQHFTGGTYWITVSKDQPLPQQLLKVLYKEITKTSDFHDPGDRFPDDLHAAQVKVKGLLDREKILLVLDDVWDSCTLQALNVISEGKKGVILTTTRDHRILNFPIKHEDGEHLRIVAEYAEIVEIPRLSKEHSWQLFSWHAFEVYQKAVPDDLRTVAEAFVEECKQLPLALKVLGSTMAGIHLSDGDKRLGRTLRGDWEKALKQLQELNRAGVWRKVIEKHQGGDDVGEDASLYDRLQWSLDNLIEHPRLKNCLYYFAAYPEDSRVPVDKLLWFWAAEGLCREEEGIELLGILVAKSVVELGHEGKWCKIHDVMRDLLRLNAKFHAGREISASKREYLCEPGVNVGVFPNDWLSPNVRLSATNLSLFDNDLQQLPDKLDAPDLRVLMLGRNMRLASLPPSFFVKLSNLRVLNLSGTAIREVPGSVLQSLKSLVLLDLRGCNRLTKVSDELDGLEHLKFLLLPFDPYERSGLILQRVPRMKSLTKLHTLQLQLPKLKSDLEVLQFCARIRDVFQLRSLCQLQIIGEGPKGRGPVPEISALLALEELRLDYFRQLPEGLLELHGLRVLQIRDIHGMIMPCLGELPLLEQLTVKACILADSGFPESFGCPGAFPSLRELTLAGIECKQIFTFQAGTMPKIEKLLLNMIVASSDSPGAFPYSMTTLGTLKYLKMQWMGIQRDYDILFSLQSCFPNLEYFECCYGGVQKSLLPSHVLEREAQGLLKIRVEN